MFNWRAWPFIAYALRSNLLFCTGLADTNAVTVDLRATNTFVYDDNGNLRTNGTEVLEYDDENHLVTNYVAAAWKSEFTYDGKNRRRTQRDYGWSGGAWVKTNETRLVYDGNLPLQHRDSGNTPTLTLTRGLDISGSFQGAGGIGGLLAMTESSGAHSFYHADGNGSVTCLINTNQLIVVKYLYDPFGRTLAINGPKATINLYCFSSKPIHVASGKYDYLYRWYSPVLQRWLNWDPLGEDGGHNLYRVFENSPANYFDAFGLESDDAKIPEDLKKCCVDGTGIIDAGERKLRKIYSLEVERLALMGATPQAPSKGENAGGFGFSCKNVSGDILSYLTAKIPPCWNCRLEWRKVSPGNKGKLISGDHAVIVCKSYRKDNDEAKRKEIMFDWWGDKMNLAYNGDVSKFRKDYPIQVEKQLNPYFRNCDLQPSPERSRWQKPSYSASAGGRGN